MRFQLFSFGFWQKLPMVLQEERAECGLACIVMICNYFGHDIDLTTLRKHSASSSLGLHLLHIKNHLEQLGFQTRALRLDLGELDLVRTPAILHWEMNHFVVLKKVKRNHLVIHDPAIGIRQISLAEASRSFTGIALEVEKKEPFEAITNSNKLKLIDMVKHITGLRLFFTVLFMLSFCLEIFNLLSPLLIQYITDSAVNSANLSNLKVVALAFFLLLGLQIWVEWTREHLGIYLGNQLTEQLSSKVFRHLLQLPLSFFEKRHKGDLQSKFQSIDQIQRKLSTDFINALLDGLFILMNLLIMLLYSRLLTGIVLVALALFVCLRAISYQIPKRQTQSVIYRHAKAASIFLETLHGMVPIKTFLKEEARFQLWRNHYIEALNADISLAKTQAIYRCLNQFLFHGEHIVVVSLGACLVIKRELSLGMLIAFLSYRLLLVNKATSLIQNTFDYQLISIQLQRLSDILFAKPEEIKPGIGSKRQVFGALRVDNISFQYETQQPAIISQLHLDIQAGEKVALIGPSGCGKSTLLKIMMGQLKPTSGKIYIDGCSLDEFGLKNYREQLACVMQDDMLLSGSIISNITFFAEEIDLDRVHTVARWACIHDSIQALPMGYETLVGDMGSSLSGGQRQRILLARALYKQPKWLFLDEATSHLDLDNEMAINRALKQLNITQIIIAHRQETIRMADRVIDLRGLTSGSGK